MAKRIQDPTRSKDEGRASLTVADAVRRAIALHREGALDGAEALYRRILAASANEPNALHFLGVLKHQRGEPDTAITLIRRAIAAAPTQADPHNNLGNILVETARPEEAATAYRRAIALKADHADALSNLGAVSRALGDAAGAEAAYRDAIAFAPEHREAHKNLGRLLAGLGRHEEAVACFWKSVMLEPKRPETRRLLAMAHYANGDIPAAVAVLDEWLADEPDSPTARHMHAACSGKSVPERASDAYVEETFDRFAESFDSKLERLSYRAPQLVGEALARFSPPDGSLDLLDAGCGTGLCGKPIRAHARRLTGVDLSGRMLAQAERLGLYDELVKDELTHHLVAHPGAYDAAISADTLNYFGALEAIFGAFATALRPGGLLVFTLEDDAGASETGGFRLNAHGRYSHSRAYLTETLAAAGFDTIAIEPGILRMEAAKPVEGLVIGARRR